MGCTAYPLESGRVRTPMTTTRASLRRLAAAVEPGPDAIGTARTIIIERVEPELDGGRYPAKRVVGDWFTVSADIIADGHDRLGAALLIRADDEDRWQEIPMREGRLDRWKARVRLRRNRWHRYTIEAWRDEVASWAERLSRKARLGLAVDIELAEGRQVLENAARRARRAGAVGDAAVLSDARARVIAASDGRAAARVAREPTVLAAGARHPDRRAASRYDRELELVVDRRAAASGAWYELFPRSQGTAAGSPTTLVEAEWRLPELARLGFGVVYLPPIHPIGTTNRKGRNNAEQAEPGDVGSPWAVGSVEGGHEAVAPELGGLEAFQHFRLAAERLGMEVALDLAIQASPDHPWVEEHPEWFRRAPDGSIRYAENPPKRYQDVYPFDFRSADPEARAALWEAWREVVLTWVERGVRIFRVDNPHTKPVAFWAWLIRDIQATYPDVIFLAEAFTRHKPMRLLSKAGFTQSYTYFTWRTDRARLREYLVELTRSEMRQYYRGNLFTNTPDINPHYLARGRATFVSRLVLAATLSGLYGIYSGFELLEHRRIGSSEEYKDSEKYEILVRKWDAPGNLKPLISSLNSLRQAWPALQRTETLRFETARAKRILFYRRALPVGQIDLLSEEPKRWRKPVWVAVNVNPTWSEQAVLRPNLAEVGIDPKRPYRYVDLLTGSSRVRRAPTITVTLGPDRPFVIFTLSQDPGPKVRSRRPTRRAASDRPYTRPGW
jgi:starch synthase (maltosyl-transferring)